MQLKTFWSDSYKNFYFSGKSIKKKKKLKSINDGIDITQCPVCEKTNLKRVVVHISKSKSCKSKCSDEVLEQLKKLSSELSLNKKKEIMREKRNTVEYKKEENEKKKKVMKEKRKQAEFRIKENEKKKKKRNNIEYRKEENEKKKKKRNNI